VDLDRQAFRQAVRDSEMSLREIATVSGVSYSTLKKYSSGQRRWPKRQTYRRLVVALGLPRGSLIVNPHTRVTHGAHTGGDE
jgi:transcriptional regulator with XRE-family HTH domain